MRKTLSLFAAMLLAGIAGMSAQVVETSPSILQESSRDVKIIFYADRGNEGLKGYDGDVYAHTGVITSLSASSGDWKYAPTWCDNSPKYKMTRTATNTYELNIGEIRTYYGITNPSETIKELAFVFRNSDGTLQGKTAAGGDIFVTVYPDEFQAVLTSNASSTVLMEPTTVNFTLNTTASAALEIKVNGTSVAKGNGMELTASHTFNEPGTYNVEGTASYNGKNVTSEMTITYVNASPTATYPGGVPQEGAVKNSDGTVTFCLAAPEKKNVMIVPSWDNYDVLMSNVMNRYDYQGNSYFWITVSGLDNTSYYPYYYLVDGTIKVGDPYARLVLDPYSDKYLTNGVFPDCPPYPYDKFDDIVLAVYRGNMDDYDWKVKSFSIPEHKDLIIYELLLRDFTGTEGQADGNGTLALAMEKLEYLRNLGVNAIELMPIMEFDGNNSWGYNTNFYFAPDKAYGSPDEYRAFIDRCHELGMAVILDVVFNQSAGLNPWYLMYPIDHNPFYNPTAPHDYSVLNDWNQDNVLVQQQWDNCITYWMTAYKVDGFRFDLVKGLGDNDSYTGGTEAYNASRVARMNRLNNVIKSINPDGIHINENLAGAREENEMAESGQLNWSNINSQSSKYAEGFAAGSSTMGFYAPNYDRTWGSTVSYAESHDEQRVNYNQTKYGANDPIKRKVDMQMRRLGSMAAQMILSPGAHMIWQFGELGDGQNTKNASGGNNTDPKIVHWDYFDNEYRHGLYDNYSALNWIRRDNSDLFVADATLDMKFGDNDWDNGRTLRIARGEKELVLLINPQIRTNVTVSVPVNRMSASNYEVLASSYDTDPAIEFNNGNVSATLLPGAFVVVATDAVQSAIEEIGVESNRPAIYGGVGQIIVEGEYTNLDVYNLAGVRLANENLAPGVYIVNVDGTTAKVFVK